MMDGHERKNAPSREAGGAQGHSHKNIIDSPSIAGGGGGGDGEGLLTGDTAAAVDFLAHWSPDGPWVLTSIVPDGGRTTTRTFKAGETGAMAAWIDERQGRQNIYFTVNRTRGPVSSKPKKVDMAAAVALHVDVDPREGEPLESERERIGGMIEDWERNGKKLPFPRPTVVIDSGGGLQCFWLLDVEADLPGEPADETRHLHVEDRNNFIAQAMGGDACQNIDRIMRLPGTVNVPGEKKRKKGRVARLARIGIADWTLRHRLETFPLAPRSVSGAGAPVAGGQARVALSTDLPKVDSLDGLPAAVSARTRMLIVNGSDPDDPELCGNLGDGVI
jgi:hypothetical protein